MRIIYLGSFRLPNFDAAAARVLNVSRALRLAGHELRFISWGGEQRECDLCSDEKYRVDGFEYMVTHELDPQGGFINRAKSKLTRGNKTKEILKEKLGSYDAIISYNGNLSRWLIKFAKRNNIKLICDLTEWYDYHELSYVDWISYTINMCCIQKRVANKIAISSFFDKYYNNTHNIIVPATCNSKEAKWHQDCNHAKQQAGGFDGITLIYAGNPARKDAIHYAINAVQKLIEEGANIRFLILGAERDTYVKKYSDLLKTKKLSKKIQFLGRVSQDNVPTFYALADFMVLLREPTRKSNAGFPTKFAESFTSGTPVIANLTSDLGLYLKDEETGFVVPEPTEESVYNTIKTKVLSLTKKQMEEMKCNVRNVAVKLDYHTFVEPLSGFMESLV